jgi:hypothetical protein
MRTILATAFLCAGLTAAAAPLSGPAAQQLVSAAGAPAEAGGRWSDNSRAQTQSAAVPDMGLDAGSSKTPNLAPAPPEPKLILPPSPVEAAEGYHGFKKGGIVGYTAVEWTPNLIANAVPCLGDFVGFCLGIGLLVPALLTGLAGGIASSVTSFF